MGKPQYKSYMEDKRQRIIDDVKSTVPVRSHKMELLRASGIDKTHLVDGQTFDHTIFKVGPMYYYFIRIVDGVATFRRDLIENLAIVGASLDVGYTVYTPEQIITLGERLLGHFNPRDDTEFASILAEILSGKRIDIANGNKDMLTRFIRSR